MDAHTLLGRGFLPKELPPLFSTETFADFVRDRGTIKVAPSPRPPSKRCTSRPCIHNLARPGRLRRRLSLPNPFNYYLLAEHLASHWKSVEKQFQRSALSMSVPKEDASGVRALVPQADDLLSIRAATRSVGRFLLRTDIARFYPSIYTHSLAWAIDGKQKAKKKRSGGFANDLDGLVREGQDGQTVGIPVGPDASLVLGELVACAIDEELADGSLTGFRHMDDYELSFRSRAKAESALMRLEETLRHFELGINAFKTSIQELPVELEHPWVKRLREFQFAAPEKVQRAELSSYFDLMFSLRDDYRAFPVITYGVSRLRDVTVDEATCELLQHLLCQALMAEPSCISAAGQVFDSHRKFGLEPSVAKALNAVIQHHTPLGHDSEVAWAIWSIVQLELRVTKRSAEAIARSLDPIVRVLALHAQEKSRVAGTVDWSGWKTDLSRDSLYDEQWLFAYEANRRGWMKASSDYVSADPNFSVLKKGCLVSRGISFLLGRHARLEHLW